MPSVGPAGGRGSSEPDYRGQARLTEEFWECYDGDLDVASARTALLAWAHRYNTVRPHQALGYLIPPQYLERCTSKRKE